MGFVSARFPLSVKDTEVMEDLTWARKLVMKDVVSDAVRHFKTAGLPLSVVPLANPREVSLNYVPFSVEQSGWLCELAKANNCSTEDALRTIVSSYLASHPLTPDEVTKLESFKAEIRKQATEALGSRGPNTAG